jgi:hypothetical protein
MGEHPVTQVVHVMQELAQRNAEEQQQLRVECEMVSKAAAKHTADEANKAQALRENHTRLKQASTKQMEEFRCALLTCVLERKCSAV